MDRTQAAMAAVGSAGHPTVVGCLGPPGSERVFLTSAARDVLSVLPHPIWPDRARGEFVNIGAVAGSDAAKEWELWLVSNFSRAKMLDDRGVLSKAFEYAASLEDRIAALDQHPGPLCVEKMSSVLLQRLPTDMQNVIQVSRPAPVAPDSAEATLDLVFDQLVLDGGDHANN